MFTLLLLTVPGLLLLSQANSYPLLLLGGLWIGLGGASFAVGVPFVSRYFPPERQGFALGVYGAGNIGAAGGLGGFFPPLIMGAVQQAFGSYRLGFLLLALTAFACLVLTWHVLQHSQPPTLQPTR